MKVLRDLKPNTLILLALVVSSNFGMILVYFIPRTLVSQHRILALHIISELMCSLDPALVKNLKVLFNKNEHGYSFSTILMLLIYFCPNL